MDLLHLKRWIYQQIYIHKVNTQAIGSMNLNTCLFHSWFTCPMSEILIHQQILESVYWQVWGLKSRAKAVDLLKLNRAIIIWIPTYPGNATLTNPGQVTYGYSHGGYYYPYCDCTVYLGSSWISLLAMQKLAECDYTYNNMTGVSLTWLFGKSVTINTARMHCTLNWTNQYNKHENGKGELNCYVLPLGQLFKVRKC